MIDRHTQYRGIHAFVARVLGTWTAPNGSAEGFIVTLYLPSEERFVRHVYVFIGAMTGDVLVYEKRKVAA